MSDYDQYGAQFIAPSGIQTVGPSDQVNSPVEASTGALVQTSSAVLSGSDKNTPPGPPIYKWNKYDFLWHAYWGTGGFYDGSVLRKLLTEIDDQYTLRRAVSYYRNFFCQIIEATYKPVFAEPCTRVTEVNEVVDEDGKLAPLWDTFLDNVDNRNHKIDAFIKRAVRAARILEVSYIVMDNLKATSDNVEIAKKNREFPYVYLRLPQQVEESMTQVDEFCKLVQICFKEHPEMAVDAKSGQMVEEQRWKLWTRDYSVKLRKDRDTRKFKEITETKVVYNLGEVPVIPVMSTDAEDDTVLPHPRFYSVARCGWSVYNFDSAEARAIYAQMFPILALPQPRTSDIPTGMASNPMQGIYLSPAENGVTPATPTYLTYPTQDFEAIDHFTQELIDDMFRQAGQLGVSGVASTAKPQSGISKSYDFHASHFVLKETAKMAQLAEEEIARVFKLYVPENFTYEASYCDDYSPDTDPEKEVTVYGDYIQLDPGNKGKALALKEASRAVFAGSDEDELQEVISDIDEHAEDETEVVVADQVPPEEEQTPADAIKEALGLKQPEEEKPAPAKKPTNKMVKSKKTLRKKNEAK
jgi:hypothetical protein